MKYRSYFFIFWSVIRHFDCDQIMYICTLKKGSVIFCTNVHFSKVASWGELR